MFEQISTTSSEKKAFLEEFFCLYCIQGPLNTKLELRPA